MRYYVLMRTDTRSAIHHARAEDGVITTRILTEGEVRLHPPGIAIALEAVFADEAA